MPTQTIRDLVALFQNKDFLQRAEIAAAGQRLDEELKLFVEREGKQPSREQMARAALAKTAPPPGKRQYNAPSQADETRRIEMVFLQRALLGLVPPARDDNYDDDSWAAHTLLVAWLAFDEGDLSMLPQITKLQAMPWGEEINPFAESAVCGRQAVRRETLRWRPRQEKIETLIKRAMELLSVPPAVASAPPESEQQPAGVRPRKSKARRTMTTKPLTEAQTEAYTTYLRNHSVAETAKELGISRGAAHDRIVPALKKIGDRLFAKRAVKSVRTQALPTDERGQPILADE